MGPKELSIIERCLNLHNYRVYMKRFNCVEFVVSL